MRSRDPGLRSQIREVRAVIFGAFFVASIVRAVLEVLFY